MKKATAILLTIIWSCQFAAGQVDDNKITLEDIFISGKFRSDNIYGINSMNNSELYSQIRNDSLNLYSYKKGEYKGTVISPQQLIPVGDSLPIRLRNYTFSKNEKKILIATDTEKLYRRSSKSNYYIYDIEKSTLSLLSSNGKQQLATFSPDASKVGFVRENNLFIRDINSSFETQITRDGEFNKIINGAPDWVYEEEFGFAKGFSWSPDSKKIAYYKFDESLVKEFQMTIWGNLYPEPYKYKYPKAGEDNSIVSIHIYNLESEKTITADLGENPTIYVPRIKWTKDPDILSIIKLNRLQNELDILLANAKNGETESIYHEVNKYYIDIDDNLTFLNDGEHFILTSEQDGNNHIYLFDILGNLEQQITKGSWDVSELIGVDEKKKIVFFSNAESSPMNREIYSIKLNGAEKTLLSEATGTNSIRFNKKFKYYINTFSDANTPAVVDVYNANGKKIRTLTENSNLKTLINEYNFSPKEFFTFSNSEGVELNGWMIKPPDFDSTLTYPVLMYVYGGPGSQTVRNSWGRGDAWYQFLAQQGLIIVSVDNRGTGARGEEFKKMTYLQLGKLETQDQIDAAKYLGLLPYVNKSKIGIWGWSYGGYMAASCLTQGADYFSMGIAVAPVTNWRYYDNIYTERFMRTPKENPDGYDENSPIYHVDKLKGKFLLIHGTADDNVHYQNSVDLVSALVLANKQFDMQFYPNSNHGIYTGKNTTFHLYSLMTNYITEHLISKDE